MTLRSLLTVPPPVSRAPLATHRPWLCAGLLALLAGLAFWPALGNDFVPFDDPYTTNLCFGGAELKTAYVTLSGTGRLVSVPWPRAGLKLAYG